jgi:hypothetical protein
VRLYCELENGLLGALAKLRRASIASSCVSLSARPSYLPNGTTRLPLDGFLCIQVFFGNPSRKVYFYKNLTRITGTLHEDPRTFVIISF